MDRNGAASDSSSGPGLVVAPKQGASYPPALAEHRAVVANKELFLDTLSRFHLALGSPLVIPTMGGKDLDLHVLYVEVTKRGGQQQVIKDRKWKEIALNAFDFEDTLTSASFVLKKYYNTHLHDYEQVHFFKSTAPSPPEAPVKKPEVINSTIRKRRLAPMPVTGSLDPAASVGNVVTGSIDGKFEQGYLVTVKVGNEKLQGVVYHVPPGCGAQFAEIAGYSPPLKSAKQTPEQRKRKLKEELRKDPNAPRATRTGYNFFYVEERAKLKLLFPDKERELSRMVGDAWNRLTDTQKLPYQEMGAKDKERYENELREYLLKGKSGTLPEAAAAVEKATTTNLCAAGEELTSKPVEIDCNQSQLVSPSSSEQEDPLNNQFQSNALAPPPPPPQARVETPQAPNQWFIIN